MLNISSQEIPTPRSKAALYRFGMEISEWVREARKKSGLTLERLGELVGRTKANVHAWEKGSHEPSYAQLLAISNATSQPLPKPDKGPKDPPHQAGGAQTSDRPTIQAALPVVLDALAAAPARDKVRAALMALLDDDAPAYRQRLAELLSSAAPLGAPIAPEHDDRLRQMAERAEELHAQQHHPGAKRVQRRPASG